MKKIFVGILCSALIAAFSGCKPNPDNMDVSYGNNDGIYPFTLPPSTGEVTAITYAPEEAVTQENEYGEPPLSPNVEGMIYDDISKYSNIVDNLTAENDGTAVNINIYDFLPILENYLYYERSEKEFELSENNVVLQWNYHVGDRNITKYFIIDENNGMVKHTVDEWGESKEYFPFDSTLLYFESIHKIVRNSTAEIGAKSTVEISDRDDILYSVTEAFPDRVTTYIENNSEMTLVWGSEFYVEKNIDGEWYTLEYIELPGDPDRTWTLEGWVVESGGTISEESCWDWDYGHLPGGDYRIIRKCNFNIGDRSPEYMTLAAEFSIS